MNLIEYLEAKYGEEGPRIITALEARSFGIKYPLQTGWLELHGKKEITAAIAHTLGPKLYEKGMRTANQSKANYCLAGASVLRKIAAADIDARIAALPAYATQACVLLHPVTPTDRQDDGAPWVGFAADIRGRA